MTRYSENVSVEHIIDKIGLGASQIILVLCVGLATLCGSSQLSSLVFVLNGLEDKIHITTADKSMLSAVTSVGALVAHVIAGNVADYYGRRNTSLLMFLVCITTSMLQGFVNSVVQLSIVRLVLGISVGALETSGRPLVAELAPAKYRSALLSTCHLAFELGFSLSVLFAWIFMNSYGLRAYLLALNLPIGLVVVMFLFFVVETPQFYICKRNKYKVEQSLKKIALLNCYHLQDEDLRRICYKRKLDDEECEDLNACQQLLQVLRTTFSTFQKPYTWHTCAFLATSLSVTVATGGLLNWLPLLFKDLKEVFINQYLQVLIIDVFVFPFIGLSVPLVDFFGSQSVGIVSCMGAGFAFLVFFFVPKVGFIPIVALIVQRGLVSVVSNSTQVAAIGTYPPKMRGTAIGLVLSCFKIGAGISSFLFPLLVSQWVYLPVLFAAAFLFQTAFFITLWPHAPMQTYHHFQPTQNDIQQGLLSP